MMQTIPDQEAQEGFHWNIQEGFWKSFHSFGTLFNSVTVQYRTETALLSALLSQWSATNKVGNTIPYSQACKVGRWRRGDTFSRRSWLCDWLYGSTEITSTDSWTAQWSPAHIPVNQSLTIDDQWTPIKPKWAGAFAQAAREKTPTEKGQRRVTTQWKWFLWVMKANGRYKKSI